METIKCCSWNANGVRSHIAELRTFIKVHKLDIIIVSETKLTQDINIRIKNFNLIRSDRTAHGGGIAIVIRNNVPYRTVGTDNTLAIENVTIQLKDGTFIIAVYNQPRNQITIADLQTLSNIGNKVLIVGDFNARHTTWKNQNNNYNGRILFNFITSSNLILQHTNSPTHFPANGMTPTFIDLILNKNVRDITEPISIPELNSDHNPVTFQLYNHNKEKNIKQVTTYKNTNWDAFRKTLSDKTVINNQVNTPESIDAEVQLLSQNILQIKNQYSQQININPNKIELDQDIMTLIKTRNRMRKEYQRSLRREIKQVVNRISRAIKSKINRCLNQKWEKTLQEVKPGDRTLWRITKSFKNPTQTIPTITKNNLTYLTDKEKADIISETLENTQKNNEPSRIENDVTKTINEYLDNHPYPDPNTIQLTNPLELKILIKKLPNNKAPGPDKIDTKLLKNLPQKTIVQLMYIINGILKTGHYPKTWKNATIIPIPKAGKDLTNPTNYRPISLLSTMSKIAEKVILKRIKDFDHKYSITLDEQFGFRTGHNTTLQVARIANSIIHNYNKNNVTSMALLDIEKAFDTVWIDGIVYKLIRYNFPAYLVYLLNNYLRQRQFRVKVNERESELRTSRAGVPQGSVLGPVLFTYFINDLPKFAKTNLAIYADDTAVYAHSFNAQVATKQCQIHCGQISDFARTWKIKLNNDKTEHIIFSRKFTNTKVLEPLNVENIKIRQAANEVRYLGVIMDKRLSFAPHIKSLVNKGHKTIRSLYPLLNRNSYLNVKNKKLLYTAIIRPAITYAGPIWCSTSKTSLNKLQRIQNKCLRLVLSRDRYTRIAELHRECDIPTIEDFIRKISIKFYREQITKSSLTSNLTDPLQIALARNQTHKPTFHKLDIN